jgi:hypothetical protein
MVALLNVNTVERYENTFIAVINTIFLTDGGYEIANGFQVSTSDGEVVNLMANQHPLTLIHAVVEAALAHE